MSLKITFTKSVNDAGQTYKDLHLDLVKDYIPYGYGNLTRSSGSNDLKADHDEMAIANSLKNLFSTRPLQRLLLPEYGLDLKQFLFEPVNEISATLIGRKIKNGIKRFEPRVYVDFIDIVVDAENNTYYITMSLVIKKLKKKVSYGGTLVNGVFDL